MKTILIVVILLAGALAGGLWMGGIYVQDREKREQLSSEIASNVAEIGIEAGINACLIHGVPTNREQLDDLRARSKGLIERVLPKTKWEWKDPKPESALPTQTRNGAPVAQSL
jgi:hypothetical protein